VVPITGSPASWSISFFQVRGTATLLATTMAPPPPPPPPPICFPFIGSKPKRRLSWSSGGISPSQTSRPEDQMIRHPSLSPTSTLTGADSLTFHSDSEKYDEVPSTLPELFKDGKGRPKLVRSNTMTGTKKSTLSNKWGYGWGIGKRKEKELEDLEKSMTSETNLPLYQPPVRRDSKSSHASRSTQATQDTVRSKDSNRTQESNWTRDTIRSQDTHRSQATQRTQDTHRTLDTHRTQDTRKSKESQGTHETPKPDPYRSNSQRSKVTTHSKVSQRSDAATSGNTKRTRFYSNDSSSTLVGSALERKLNEVDSIKDTGDTDERLADLRKSMETHQLDY
jgi:Xaa-Pro aminopeptidase